MPTRNGMSKRRGACHRCKHLGKHKKRRNQDWFDENDGIISSLLEQNRAAFVKTVGDSDPKLAQAHKKICSKVQTESVLTDCSHISELALLWRDLNLLVTCLNSLRLCSALELS